MPEHDRASVRRRLSRSDGFRRSLVAAALLEKCHAALERVEPRELGALVEVAPELVHIGAKLGNLVRESRRLLVELPHDVLERRDALFEPLEASIHATFEPF